MDHATYRRFVFVSSQQLLDDARALRRWLEQGPDMPRALIEIVGAIESALEAGDRAALERALKRLVGYGELTQAGLKGLLDGFMSRAASVLRRDVQADPYRAAVEAEIGPVSRLVYGHAPGRSFAVYSAITRDGQVHVGSVALDRELVADGAMALLRWAREHPGKAAVEMQAALQRLIVQSPVPRFESGEPPGKKV